MSEQGAPGAGAGGEGGAAASPWAGLKPENRGYVELKGFRDHDSVVQAYRELESFRGVPAERLLKLPDKEDAPEWGGIYGRLGRPETPEGYELQGADAELLARLHSGGVSKRAAHDIAAYLGERAKAAQEKAEAERAERHQLEEQELRREWGQEFDRNIRNAREVYQRAAKAVGWESPEAMQADFDQIENQIGTMRLLKLMAFMGAGTAPARFVEGDQGGGSPFGDATPEAAMANFRKLSQDREFMKRVDSGDVTAVAQYERAARLAAPGYKAGGPQ